MSQNILIWIAIVGILVFAISVVAFGPLLLVQGQEIASTTTTTTAAEPTMAEPAVSVDPSNVVATGGILGAGAAIINTILNARKQKENVKGTDVDFAKTLARIAVIFQIAYEISPEWRRILDTRANRSKLDKTTVGEDFIRDVAEWATFVQEKYNAVSPNINVDPSRIEKKKEEQEDHPQQHHHGGGGDDDTSQPKQGNRTEPTQVQSSSSG